MKYFDGWLSKEGVESDYPQVKDLSEDELIYAGYTYGDYSGDAIVVFKKDGKLFENHDGHCSCYGLENWQPEETSAEAIIARPETKRWEGLREALGQVQ